MSSNTTLPSPTPAARAPSSANVVLGALFVLYIFNFVDRYILSLLLDPIKRDLALSDTQLGLLSGPAFAILYATGGIPLARYADRGSRTRLITAGFVVWSAMTAACGMAKSYTQLLIARVGVGIGEASFTPTAHSLIADYFPPARRALAMAVFAAGATVGTMFGNLIGGYLGDSLGWRQTFMIVGLPGIAAALVFHWTVREPERGSAASEQPGVLATLRALSAQPAYRWVVASAALHGFSSYGSGAWNASFLRRVFELPGSEVGVILAINTGLSVVGQLGFGRLADRLSLRDPRYVMWVPAATSIAALPFLIGFTLAPTPRLSIASLILGGAVVSAWTGPTYATAQSLVAPRVRAMASAILLFAMNMIGIGLGPLAVGALNDWLAPHFGTDAIRYSLLIVVLPHTLASAFNLLAARKLRRDLARVES
jgi:predicted MFS family arabinose efflux permease